MEDEWEEVTSDQADGQAISLCACIFNTLRKSLLYPWSCGRTEKGIKEGRQCKHVGHEQKLVVVGLFNKTASMATSSTTHVKELSSADSFSETTESESEEELPSLPELSLPSDNGKEEMDLWRTMLNFIWNWSDPFSLVSLSSLLHHSLFLSLSPFNCTCFLWWTDVLCKSFFFCFGSPRFVDHVCPLVSVKL